MRVVLVVAILLVGTPACASGPALKRVEALTRKVTPQVVDWRRHIHANPELSNREKQTAAYVVARLKELGVDDIRTGVAHHGVVALIKGAKPGGVVALRADMDALPVQEASGESFASKNPGIMHACGHDVHTSVLLGAAAVLVQMRDVLPGTVKLVFQPAEEGPPAGEQGGASLMVKEGALDNPRPTAIFALHTLPELDAGTLGFALGGMFASVDRFRIRVIGQQTHAAYPQGGVDPIVAAAHIITALQTLPTRIIDARDPIVVSVGVVKGGQRWNIIPGEVLLEGTVRTQSKHIRHKAEIAFKRLVENTAKAHRTKTEIAYEDLAPVTWNDPVLGRKMHATLVRAAGEKNVLRVRPAMGGEDFAYFAKEIPGFYIRLGVGTPGQKNSPLHTPGYRANESALPLGVRTMTLLALDYLGSL
jgi:amidohydrolase